MNAKVKRKLYQVFSGVRRPTSHGVSTMWPDNDCLIGLEVEAEHIRYKYVNTENTVDPAYEGATTTGYPSTAMRFWGWEQVPDGSLGPGGREFRFSAPLKGAALENAITNFFDIVTFREAPRAGIHVHVDWTDCDDIDTLTTLLAILCGIEPAIFNMVGHGRKENTFCKPLSTLPQSQIAEVLQSGQFDVLRNKLHGCDVAAEASRYYGANFASLAKHGTVEFRYFPSLYDKDKVIMWVQLLMQLRAASFDPALTPTAVVDKMSTAAGIREFITDRFAFGNSAEALLSAMDIHATAKSMKTLACLLKADLSYGRRRTTVNGASTSMQRFLRKNMPDVAARQVELENAANAIERAAVTDSREDALPNLERLYRAIRTNSSNF